MTKEEIIKALRDMARYPTVTLPRDTEALKTAADLLAQPEQKRPQNCGTGYCSCIECLFEQSEQELVKWSDYEPDGVHHNKPVQKRPQNCGTGYCSCVKCVMEPKQEPVGEAHQMSELVEGFTHCIWDERVIPVGTKLYTSPPAQRTWVGLTKEEIKAFDTWHDNREEEKGWVAPSEIVAYLDTKFKEKNHG